MLVESLFNKSPLMEAVDYASLFNGIIELNQKYRVFDQETTKKRINDEIKAVKQEVGNYKWNFYLLRILRHSYAFTILHFITNKNIAETKDIQKLKKILEPNFPSVGTWNKEPNFTNYIQTKNLFKHAKGINYPKIQNYDPEKKSPTVVASDLKRLEEEYLDEMGDDARFVEHQDGDKIIKEYPNGFVWMMLARHYCSDEADAMGHCGNSGGGSDERILSFRKKRQEGKETLYEPFLTFIYDQSEKTLGERKGRANTKPAKRYHPYIIDLLKMDFIKGFGAEGWLPKNNFSMTDLTDDQRKEVIAVNPNLAMYPGAPLKDFPDSFFEKYKFKSANRKHIWADPETKRMYVNIDIDDVVSKRLLRKLDEPFDSDYFEEDYSDFSEKNLAIIYDSLVNIATLTNPTDETEMSKDDFIIYVSRYGIDSDFKEVNFEDNDDFEEILENLSQIFRIASESAQQDAFYEELLRQIKSTELQVGAGEMLFEGFLDAGQTDPSIQKHFDADSKVVYDTSIYFTEDEIYDAEIKGFVDELDSRFGGGYVTSEILNDTFSDYFEHEVKQKETTESKHETSKSQAGEWVEANKKDFKKRYGKEWEQKLHAEAWQKFGKKNQSLTEHSSYKEYVDPWRQKGFRIKVEPFIPMGSNSRGIKFLLNNKGIDTYIVEPEDGIYLVAGDDKEYGSFDEAMNAVIKTTFKDQNITEGNIMNESVNRLKWLAGVPEKSDKQINEMAEAIPATIVLGPKNELSSLIEKLNQIRLENWQVMPPLDPNNIPVDTTVKINLPRLIRARDYHDFEVIESMIKRLGIKVVITEVGFDGEYLGLAHTGSENHLTLVSELQTHYKNLTEEELTEGKKLIHTEASHDPKRYKVRSRPSGYTVENEDEVLLDPKTKKAFLNRPDAVKLAKELNDKKRVKV
jgi:hypothetical protein